LLVGRAGVITHRRSGPRAIERANRDPIILAAGPRHVERSTAADSVDPKPRRRAKRKGDLMRPELDKQFRRELDRMTETEVRDDLNFRRGLGTGGETKREQVIQWLRQRERTREARERLMVRVTVATFVIAVFTLIAAIAAVVVPFVHP
jgi:hypothetical protein